MRAEDAPPAVIRGMTPDSAISRGSVPLGTGAGEGHGRVWCGDVGAWSWGLGVLGFGKQECEREREGAWGVPPPLPLPELPLISTRNSVSPMERSYYPEHSGSRPITEDKLGWARSVLR